MTTQTQGIAAVGTVFVTVTDIDAAIAFYTEQLGMELRSDVSYGEDNRWVEVAPPGAQTVIALNLPMQSGEGANPGDNLQFGYDCDDFEASYELLKSRGVEFEEPMRMDPPVPPMAFFRDQDGNRALLVQRNG
jgi:catechol 2,3-dioxygenase-like lactoylglutathione lyase family enzyme